MAKQIAVSGLASVKRKVSKSAQKRLGSFAFPQNCKGWQDLKELEDQQPQHSAQTTVATKSKGKGTPAAHTKSAEGKDAFIKSEGTSVSGLQSSELDNKTSPTTRLLTHQHAMATSSQSNSRKKGDTGFRMDAGIVDHANKYLYTKDGASMSDSKGTKTYYRTPFSDPAVKFKSAGYPSGSTNSPDPQQFSADEAPGEDWTVVPQKTRSKAKPAKPRQRTYQGTARWKNKWTKPAPPPADKVASSHASTAPRGKQQVWNSSVTGQAARGHPESQSAHTLVEHKSDNPATARSVIETTSKSQSEHDRSEAQDSDTTTRASNAPSGLKVAGAAERDMMQGPENLPTALSSCAPESICGDDGEDVKNSVVSSQVAESTFESQLAPVETQTELRDADPRHPAHEILAAQQSGYAPGDIPLHPGATAWYPHPGYEGGQSQSFNNPDYYTPFQPFPNHAQHYHDSYEIHATDATGWSPYSFHPPGFMNFTTPHQGYYTHTAGYYPPSHGPMYSGPGPQPDLSYYPSGPMVNDHSNALLNDNNTENMSQYHSHESYRPIEEHDSYVEPPAEAIVEENKDELEQSISDDDISSDEGSKWMKRRRSI
nr:uncharacterized protein CI109_004242 [Kwoniella shandongensis]KAA5527426.1 hypothetical protein CI109_004242 [Kwoniella shandongensis]